MFRGVKDLALVYFAYKINSKSQETFIIKMATGPHTVQCALISLLWFSTALSSRAGQSMIKWHSYDFSTSWLKVRARICGRGSKDPTRLLKAHEYLFIVLSKPVSLKRIESNQGLYGLYCHLFLNFVRRPKCIEVRNVIKVLNASIFGPKCNKSPKCINIWSLM